MSRKIILILLGVFAFFVVLGIGAVAGGAFAYFALQARPALASNFIQVEADPDRESGLLVAGVVDGSPAAEAGLVRGDILLEVDGAAADSPADLAAVLEDRQAGDTIELRVLHGDEERTLTATIGAEENYPFLGIEACGFPFQGELFFRTQESSGAVVTQVTPGSPAESAGLQEGDRIVAVDGEELTPENSLSDLITAHEPGDTVTLTVEREGEAEPVEIQVTLGENPEAAGRAYLGILYNHLPALPMGEPFHFFRERPFRDRLPFELPQELPEGVNQAAVVGRVVPDSPAAEAGLEEGDLITAINGEPVENPETLRSTLQDLAPGDEVTLQVFRPGESETQEISLTLAEDPEEEGRAYLGITVLGFIRIQTDENGSLLPDIDIDLNWPGSEFLEQFRDRLRERGLPGVQL